MRNTLSAIVLLSLLALFTVTARAGDMTTSYGTITFRGDEKDSTAFDERRFDMNYKNAPIRRILQDVAFAHELEVVLPPDPSLNRTKSLHVENVSLNTVYKVALSYYTTHRHVIENNRIRIITEAEVKALPKRLYKINFTGISVKDFRYHFGKALIEEELDEMMWVNAKTNQLFIRLNPVNEKQILMLLKRWHEGERQLPSMKANWPENPNLDGVEALYQVSERSLGPIPIRPRFFSGRLIMEEVKKRVPSLEYIDFVPEFNVLKVLGDPHDMQEACKLITYLDDAQWLP